LSCLSIEPATSTPTAARHEICVQGIDRDERKAGNEYYAVWLEFCYLQAGIQYVINFLIMINGLENVCTTYQF
jgi:hypothetical protein